MNKTLCLIPARGGSKRIPRKNVLPLAGKPLLAYSIEAAKEAGVFEEVVVSSDDEEILSLAETLGVSSDRRPEQFSGDTVRFVEVINEYLLRPGVRDRFQNISCLLPTCPFRIVEDVRRAVDLFLRERHTCPRLVGVTKYSFPPQLALRKADETNLVDMREPESYGFSTRSQDLETLYYPNGSIYLSTVEQYLKTKTFFGRPMVAYVMPEERSLDVDYPYQLQIAECMMKALL